MKKYIFIILLILLSLNESYSQCASIVASPASASCSTSYNFNVIGNVFGTTFDFNSGTLPPGWNATAFVVGSPCYTQMVDGSPYYWASAISGQRYVVTNSMNVLSGGNIEFYMRYGSDDPSNGCEDPDYSAEGVFLQYSVNNGASWNTIQTWAPVSGKVGPLYSWNLYNLAIPAGAQSSATKFRWFQPQNSGTGYDNWGLDNIEVSAVNANTTFNWDFGDGITSTAQNPSHSYLNPGTYTVTLTVTGPTCNTTATTTVVVSPGPTLSINSTDASNCNTSDGTITLTFNGAQSPITYAWNPALSNSGYQTGLAAGFYDVLVTDNNGCNASSTIEIGCCSIPNTMTPSPITVCDDLTGNNQGQYQMQNADDLIRTDPTHTVTYFQDIALTMSINAAMNYPVTDATIVYAVVTNGPCQSLPIPVEFEVSTILGLTSVTHTTCSLDNGVISIDGGSATGGFSPYTYSLNGGPFTTATTYSSLSSGSYYIVSKDANGCENAIDSKIINDSDPLDVSATPTHTLCDGNNGEIDVTVNTGVLPVTYTMGGTSVTFPMSGLSAGVYSFQGTDDTGCTMDFDVTINGSDPLVFTTDVSNTTCGFDNGGINATVVSGTGPFSFKLNGISVYLPITNLAAGTYTLSAEDALGCQSSMMVNVGSSISMNYVLSVDNTSCGEDNGVIYANIISSNGDVTFILNAQEVTMPLEGMPPGNYTIYASDEENCYSFQSIEIQGSIALELDILDEQPSCGFDNGAIDVDIVSSNGAVNYTLDGVPVDFPVTDLSPGNYVVEGQDNNGCVSTIDVELEKSYPLSFYTYQYATTCANNNGSIELVPIHSTGAIAMTINGVTTNSLVRNGLPPGTYIIEASDEDNCYWSGYATIDDSEPMTFNVNVSPSPSCGDGFGNVSVYGNNNNNSVWYYIEDYGSSNDGYYECLPLGGYTMAANDFMGCTSEVSFTIGAMTTISANVDVTPATCKDNYDGIAELVAYGGAEPYTYHWNEINANGPIQENLAPGFYTVLITDSNGDEGSVLIEVEYEDLIAPYLTKFKFIAYIGQPFSVQNNIAPFVVENCEIESVTADLPNLNNPGGYLSQVVMKDVNNNVHTVYVLIVVTYPFNIMQSTPTNGTEDELDVYTDKVASNKSLNVFPNPVTGHQFMISNKDFESKELMVDLIDMNGSVIYSAPHTFISGQTNVPINVQSKGVYFIRIVDQNSIYTERVVILE